MRDDIKNFISGILIGISNAIPGVSGGTMAVVLGIYDKILNCVSISNIKDNKRFLISFILGAGVGIIGLSKLIVPLRENYPIQLGFSFLGLIVGSIPLIYKNATKGSKVKIYNIILGFVGFLFMLALNLFKDSVSSGNGTEIVNLDIKMIVLLILSGIIASIAMIIPGISGSLVMLLIGTYNIVIESIGKLEFSIIIPTGIGVLIGLLVGIQGVKKALKLFPQAMYFIILGLILGSILSIYPGWTNNITGYSSIVLFSLFSYIAFMFSREE